MDDGERCGVEIKQGANKTEDAAQNLLKVKDVIIANKGKAPNLLYII